ncbi:hypothetical protein [Inquilinus limosus]|uniref:hypothetical protein n=1 Tax=Inquilinus limosus TaxID=171674 RepID=UPI00126A2EF7|nr:hypothetical protein [Inquilinus limosus]
MDLLPQDKRPDVAPVVQARRQERRHGRGTLIFDNVVKLFEKSPRAEWTAPAIQSALQDKGVQAEPKQIHNVLGYLAREGKLVRVDRGRYHISGYGIGIETGDECDDYDGGRRQDGD